MFRLLCSVCFFTLFERIRKATNDSINGTQLSAGFPNLLHGSYMLFSFKYFTFVCTGRFCLCCEGFLMLPSTSKTPVSPIILFWSSVHAPIRLQVIIQRWCFIPNDACTYYIYYMMFVVQPLHCNFTNKCTTFPYSPNTTANFVFFAPVAYGG